MFALDGEVEAVESDMREVGTVDSVHHGLLKEAGRNVDRLPGHKVSAADQSRTQGSSKATRPPQVAVGQAMVREM